MKCFLLLLILSLTQQCREACWQGNADEEDTTTEAATAAAATPTWYHAHSPLSTNLWKLCHWSVREHSRSHPPQGVLVVALLLCPLLHHFLLWRVRKAVLDKGVCV